MTAFLALSLGVEVFKRYLFGMSSPYTGEISTFLFLWIVYIGVPYALRRNVHITLDLLPRDLSLKTNTILSLIEKLIMIGFFLFFIVQVSELVMFNRSMEVNTDALGMPVWIILLCFPIGFSLGVIRLLQSFVFTVLDYLNQSKANKGI